MDEKKNNDKQSNSDRQTNIPLVICVITVIGNIIVAIIQVSCGSRSGDTQIDDKAQCFNVEITQINRAGVEYIQYEMETDPSLSGYHVIVFFCETRTGDDGSTEYIPVSNIFTQNEYVADEKGRCVLLEEIVSKTPSSEKNHVCILAVDYIEDEIEKKDIFLMRNGQIVEAEEEVFLKVMEAYGL